MILSTIYLHTARHHSDQMVNGPTHGSRSIHGPDTKSSGPGTIQVRSSHGPDPFEFHDSRSSYDPDRTVYGLDGPDRRTVGPRLDREQDKGTNSTYLTLLSLLVDSYLSRPIMNLLPSSLLLLTLLHRTTPQTITGTYLPLAYTITYPQPEFLYERITQKNEHLTSSVYVVEGNELTAAIMIEGPVAPIDVDLNTEQEHSGVEL